MAKVERLICDLDGREEDVRTVVVQTLGEPAWAIDLCGKCYKSRLADLHQVSRLHRRPARRGQIVKRKVVDENKAPLD